MASPGAIGIALRDRVSGRIVGYALASPLEKTTTRKASCPIPFRPITTPLFYSTGDAPHRAEHGGTRAVAAGGLAPASLAAGFEFLSTLIEARVLETGPKWLADATILERVENYLRSGIAFVYVQVALAGTPSA